MEWVKWFGAGIVLLMAVLLAVSVMATPAPSVPTVVLLEGESAPETSPPAGPVVVPPSVVELGDDVPKEAVGEPSDDETEGDDDGPANDEDAQSGSPPTSTTSEDGPRSDEADGDEDAHESTGDDDDEDDDDEDDAEPDD
jgi:hypothetical protein